MLFYKILMYLKYCRLEPVVEGVLDVADYVGSFIIKIRKRDKEHEKIAMPFPPEVPGIAEMDNEKYFKESKNIENKILK